MYRNYLHIVYFTMHFSEKIAKNRDFAIDTSKKVVVSSLKEDLRQSKELFSYNQILKLTRDLLSQVTEDTFLIPISVFNEELGALGSIVKYLRENCKLRFSKIGALLGRNDVAVGNCYRDSVKKFPVKFKVRKSEFNIPTSIFRDRGLGVLENLVLYVKKNYGLRFKEIAVLLHRDDRTIWTAYDRALKKMGNRK